MSKPISISLSDAQCAALAAEAEAAGLKFFDHCRAKLLADTHVSPKPVGEGGTTPAKTYIYGRSPAMQALPQLKRDNEQTRVETPKVDRIDRLEALVMQMAETVSNLAQPRAIEAEIAQEPYEADVDIDDVVAQSLGEAERQGLTIVERDVAPAATGGVRHVGTRPPSPFSPTTQPRHLQGLGG